MGKLNKIVLKTVEFKEMVISNKDLTKKYIWC